MLSYILIIVFFFNDTATTEIYTLSLHDALPIYCVGLASHQPTEPNDTALVTLCKGHGTENLETLYRYLRNADRKSTRLNSSHANISYAVFCLKKKKIYTKYTTYPNLSYHITYRT